jgi:hypothetical protein
MKKIYIAAMSALMIGLIVLNGCTSGITKEDFAQVQNDLADAQNRIAALETRAVTFSAYHIWYDQFYGLGNHEFADSDTFIAEFGGVVEFIGDSDLQTAWSNYLSPEKPLTDYLAGLPVDQTTWTDEQTSQFNDLETVAYNALSPIGQALLSAIWNFY